MALVALLQQPRHRGRQSTLSHNNSLGRGRHRSRRLYRRQLPTRGDSTLLLPQQSGERGKGLLLHFWHRFLSHNNRSRRGRAWRRGSGRSSDSKHSSGPNHQSVSTLGHEIPIFLNPPISSVRGQRRNRARRRGLRSRLRRRLLGRRGRRGRQGPSRGRWARHLLRRLSRSSYYFKK